MPPGSRYVLAKHTKHARKLYENGTSRARARRHLMDRYSDSLTSERCSQILTKWWGPKNKSSRRPDGRKLHITSAPTEVLVQSAPTSRASSSTHLAPPPVDRPRRILVNTSAAPSVSTRRPPPRSPSPRRVQWAPLPDLPRRTKPWTEPPTWMTERLRKRLWWPGALTRDGVATGVKGGR